MCLRYWYYSCTLMTIVFDDNSNLCNSDNNFIWNNDNNFVWNSDKNCICILYWGFIEFLFNLHWIYNGKWIYIIFKFDFHLYCIKIPIRFTFLVSGISIWFPLEFLLESHYISIGFPFLFPWYWNGYFHWCFHLIPIWFPIILPYTNAHWRR